MKILVCVKQVVESMVGNFEEHKSHLDREKSEVSMNPYDRYGIEIALKMKEDYGAKVAVLSMGPSRNKEMLRKALALGVDEVFLLNDKRLVGSDTFATAYSLSRLIRKIGEYDLIICGVKAIDGDTAQVGPQIAANLNIPQITYVNEIMEYDGNDLIVNKRVSDGNIIVKVKPPCLITVNRNIAKLTLLHLGQVKLSYEKEISELDIETINIKEEMVGILGSKTKVFKVYKPEYKNQCEMIYNDCMNNNIDYMLKQLQVILQSLEIRRKE